MNSVRKRNILVKEWLLLWDNARKCIKSMKNLPKIVIACNGTKAEFHTAKFSKLGRSINKCIKYEGKWLNPIEFEGACGIIRKWHTEIQVFLALLVQEWSYENSVVQRHFTREYVTVSCKNKGKYLYDL